jgi:hypothetical protein
LLLLGTICFQVIFDTHSTHYYSYLLFTHLITLSSETQMKISYFITSQLIYFFTFQCSIHAVYFILFYLFFQYHSQLVTIFEVGTVMLRKCEGYCFLFSNIIIIILTLTAISNFRKYFFIISLSFFSIFEIIIRDYIRYNRM